MWIDDFIGLFETYNKGDNCKIILETWNGDSARFYLDLPSNIQRRTYCFGSWQPPGYKAIGRNAKSVRKAEIIIALRKLLAKDLLRIPNEPTLIKQLSIYREDDIRLPTDRVISLALVSWLATDGRPKVDKFVPETVSW